MHRKQCNNAVVYGMTANGSVDPTQQEQEQEQEHVLVEAHLQHDS
jgi:hypothetical protein